jgi:hypothetical protein
MKDEIVVVSFRGNWEIKYLESIAQFCSISLHCIDAHMYCAR